MLWIQVLLKDQENINNVSFVDEENYNLVFTTEYSRNFSILDNVKNSIEKNLTELINLSKDEILDQRKNKFLKTWFFKEIIIKII